MAKTRCERRPPLRTERSIALACKREDVWMKAAQREALEQRTCERRAFLVVFVLGAVVTLGSTAAGHPMWALGGVGTSIATAAASALWRLRPPGGDKFSSVDPPPGQPVWAPIEAGELSNVRR